MGFLYWCNPFNWLKSAIGIGLLCLAAVSLVGWGVRTYNAKVSAAAVVAALAKERAVTTPAFNALTKQFKDIESNVIETRKQAKEAADAAIAKEKNRADQATIKYQGQVRVVKEMAADRQAVLVDFNQLPNSMWNYDDFSAANDSGSTGIVRLSGYTRRLIKRYESCERDLNAAIGIAAAAVDRAAIRGAAVEALKR
jgi:hypothetical protein